jgi:hypothetical protein
MQGWVSAVLPIALRAFPVAAAGAASCVSLTMPMRADASRPCATTAAGGREARLRGLACLAKGIHVLGDKFLRKTETAAIVIRGMRSSIAHRSTTATTGEPGLAARTGEGAEDGRSALGPFRKQFERAGIFFLSSAATL